MDKSNSKCHYCTKETSNPKCQHCLLIYCKDCEKNHIIKKCVHCKIESCNFITCQHNAIVCLECCDEINMHPVDLVRCNGCDVVCACARPCRSLVEPLQEEGIICELCLNVGFQCNNCIVANKPVKAWPKCQECESYVCNICGISCMGLCLGKKCNIVCDRCISDHSWQKHSIYDIVPQLAVHLDEAEECSVCYDESKEMISFPYCKHKPNLCKNCAMNMNKMKCILNCSKDSKKNLVDIWGKPGSSLKLNNGKPIVSKFFNKVHEHLLHWKELVMYQCSLCNKRGRSCYSCNFCNYNVCSQCLEEYV